MNCRKFESQLEWFLAEKLSSDSMHECRVHLESCSECRELLDLAEREVIQAESPQEEELVQAVLKNTSGGSCSEAHELLPDYVDGVMTRASSGLVKQHLEYCSSCQQIQRTMKELKEELPGLVEIDPGSSFTSECIRAIRQMDNRAFFMRPRHNRFWYRWIARPRMAWEAAYAMTLLLFFSYKILAIISGWSSVDTVRLFPDKSAQVFVSAATIIQEDLTECRLLLANGQDRWQKSSSERKKELSATISGTADRTKQYWQSISNGAIQLRHSIWNGIVDKLNNDGPGNGATL